MTCGVCHPQAFRPTKGARVFGYAAFASQRSASTGASVPDLHYMGAETVFTDHAAGHVRSRSGYAMLCKVLRNKDRLILDREESMGTKPGYRARNIARIEAMGVEVMVLTNHINRADITTPAQ